MAWTSPMTFVSNNVLTASQLNTHLRDNLLETGPAKATTSGGSYFIGQGPNSIAERIMKANRTTAIQSTKSNAYTNLPTTGPVVTVETGTRALVFLGCALTTDTDQAESSMGFAVTGETNKAASDDKAFSFSGFAISGQIRSGMVFYVDDLNPGQNSFTAKYRCSEGTSSFWDRFIAVMPL